ncbi:hypothetical protein HLB35_07290 [Halomonas sp. TBZ9]|uniref:Uncharacterized protein n=1 Tax=Vreelandella azerica TaxID=2732867 RepID=A0A7Y3XAU8_9GAMM|nr:hypothetical protein [Halomonas azerica]NOG31621.1 hypothetical protein [Halomonas azerica]
MEKDLVKRAHDAFNQGDYKAAKELYSKAAQQYGEKLFDINIALCEQSIAAGEGEKPPGIKQVLESKEIQQLNEQIADLKRQLQEKDANINERFEELAILTRMLEERNNPTSA